MCLKDETQTHRTDVPNHLPNRLPLMQWKSIKSYTHFKGTLNGWKLPFAGGNSHSHSQERSSLHWRYGESNSMEGWNITRLKIDWLTFFTHLIASTYSFS